MNILNLRRAWLFLMICLLLLTIISSHIFGHYSLPWWNAAWIGVPLALGVIASDNDWIIFRPVRWLTWINIRDGMERKLKELSNNPMVYPALLWLNGDEAEHAFIRGGMAGIHRGFDGFCELSKAVKPVAISEERADEVLNEMLCDGVGGCGCHNSKCVHEHT